MANARDVYEAHQRRRWTRPDADRWLRPDAARFLNPGADPDIVLAPQRKFDLDQPRVPAGNPDGGQWADGGDERADANENDLVQDILAQAKQLRLTASPANYQRCLDLCYRILERTSPPWSDRNTWDFHKCMNACLGVNR